MFLIRNRFKFIKTIVNIYWSIITYLYNFVIFFFKGSNFFSKKFDSNFYNYYIKKQLNDFYLNSILTNKLVNLDLLYSFLFSKKYSYFLNNNLFRSYFRAIQTKQGFYQNFIINLYLKKTFLNQLKFALNYGLKHLWYGIRIWILALSVTLILIYYSMVIRCLPFTKVTFIWIIALMFSYWLISGFVFFVKKYQFGKYTSVIQRFWRRSYILFWVLEFCVFGVYFYLTINANQESFYMFDQIQVFKTHLFSWRLFLIKLFPLTFLLIFGYLFLLSLKWNLFGKHVLWLSLITILLTYIVWVEFYQFFHVVNYYGNLNWIYDIDDRNWTLELEPKKTRTVNHYVMFMLILKFWHIVFIFGFWVFFVLRSVEIGRIRYPMVAANLQNFVILYLFAWVFMYPWIKFVFRHYLDNPYYWFYVNNRRLGYRIFFGDVKLIYYGIIDYLWYNRNVFNFFNKDFFYWNLTNNDFNFDSYRKGVVKNIILSKIN